MCKCAAISKQVSTYSHPIRPPLHNECPLPIHYFLVNNTMHCHSRWRQIFTCHCILFTYANRKQSLATNLTTWCHRKQSLLILFTVQSYKSYYMVSPQTVFTYPFHHAKLQILLHGVTANSLYLSFSPCKATNLTAWCHRKLVFTYAFHHAKLQILPKHGSSNFQRLIVYFSPFHHAIATRSNRRILAEIFTGCLFILVFNIYTQRCIFSLS